jgi:hypothetical protein
MFGLDSEAQAAALLAKDSDASKNADVSAAVQRTVPNGAISPATRLSSPNSDSTWAETPQPDSEAAQSAVSRRAIVVFVEDKPHLIQQVMALRLSWLWSQSPDTDLVVFGSEEALARFPDDVVKIPQHPAANDPAWRGYNRVNSITCFNGAGAEQLDRYSHIMRTDIDTFITPAWNQFYPSRFTHGKGGYSNNDDVRQRLRNISAEYGLVHRGMTNVGMTWYGPTAQVRRTCAFAEMIAKHIITQQFATEEGKWPGWYRGVSVMYSGEIAVNHCAPDAQRSDLLEATSTSTEAITRYPHIHCYHTDKKFSKHWFMGRRYTQDDAKDLDMNVIRDYCLGLSFQSLEELALAR